MLVMLFHKPIVRSTLGVVNAEPAHQDSPDMWYSHTMPTLNSIKEYDPHSYYHVYNRGLDKDKLFNDNQDYNFFLKLLARYLDPNYKTKPGEIPRPSYANEIDLITFCIMPNHYHLLIFQNDNEKAIEKLCRSIMTAYAMYYNQKYKRIGPLFQGRYRASRIVEDSYLHHISRYIHLNPLDIGEPYQTYQYSSYPRYSQNKESYLKKHHVLGLFKNSSYSAFVDEYAPVFKNRSKDDWYEI